MREFFVALFLSGSMIAWAGFPTRTQPLNSTVRAELLNSLGEILSSGTITQEIYERSVYWVNANPCVGVKRYLSKKRIGLLEAAISKEQGIRAVQIFSYFEYNRWFVVYSNASDGDEPFAFYSESPFTGAHPKAYWSGANAIFETDDLVEWTIKNVNGIPPKLAECFAWHTTFQTGE
jgi:hypothetical protein